MFCIFLMAFGGYGLCMLISTKFSELKNNSWVSNLINVLLPYKVGYQKTIHSYSPVEYKL